MNKWQWMEEALRLHFDEKLSRMKTVRRLNIADSTLYEFFNRFTRCNLTWPLPDGMTMSRLEKQLYPGKTVKKRRKKPPLAPALFNKKQRRPNFPEEFKRRLIEQSLQPGINIAQLARDNNINDNLLFNWRRRYLQKQNKSSAVTPVTLIPVEIAERQPAVIDGAFLDVPKNEDHAELCSEVHLPGGSVKLSGAVTPALLLALIGELKRSSQ
ncbi:TPA: transposase [Enterobacter cloacae]|nr:transposase [Enterobacter cloacae]